MADIQQVSMLAQQISSNVTQAALYGAHISAIVNSIQDTLGFIVFLTCTFLLYRSFRIILNYIKELKKKNKYYDLADAIEKLGIFNGIIGFIGMIGFIIGFFAIIFNALSIFMDFYGLTHPNVYLAYQIMNKVIN